MLCFSSDLFHAKVRSERDSSGIFVILTVFCVLLMNRRGEEREC
ncbi:hypothetical protein HMPREF1986_02333 [Oribacterium sp. oral taxon 078 str. F0263]|nr:hypothetical protein GCWU000341_01478 [Oribacterium sp. oral taxon 078 str. F0262]ERL05775.1 hypothetical protein HMPREF1986_02333 [Oribacterium sp. oral taxon 078 str. F0263]